MVETQPTDSALYAGYTMDTNANVVFEAIIMCLIASVVITPGIIFILWPERYIRFILRLQRWFNRQVGRRDGFLTREENEPYLFELVKWMRLLFAITLIVLVLGFFLVLSQIKLENM